MLTHGGVTGSLILHYICMCFFIYAICYGMIHIDCMYVFLSNLCLLVPCHVTDLLRNILQLTFSMFLFTVCPIGFQLTDLSHGIPLFIAVETYLYLCL